MPAHFEGTHTAAFTVLDALSTGPTPQAFEVMLAAVGSPDADRDPEFTDVCRLGRAVVELLASHQRREADVAALVDTARELASSSDVDALLRVVTRRTRLLLGVDMAYVGVPEGESGTMFIRSADGHTSALSVGLRLPGDAGAGNRALLSAAPFWTSDYLADPRLRHSEEIDEVVHAEGLHAIMAVPLVVHGGTPFGALYAASRVPRHFSADEVALAGSLGELAGVALDQAMIADRNRRTAAELAERGAHAEAVVAGGRSLIGAQDGLLDLVLVGCDLTDLVCESALRLAGPVRVHGLDGEVLATSPGPDDGTAPRIGPTEELDVRASPGPVLLDDGWWAVPVRAGAEDLCLVFARPSESIGEFGRDLVAFVARAVAVHHKLDRRAAVAEDDGRDELLDELLVEPPQPPQRLERRARRVGLDLSEPHVVVLVRPETGTGRRISTWASGQCRRRGGVKSQQRGCTVLLLPGDDGGRVAREVYDELAEALRVTVTVAASDPFRGAAGVLHAHRQARRCLDAMSLLGTARGHASAEELGFLGVLLSDNHDVDGYLAATIGPVVDYDRLRSADLMRTLSAYFAEGGSPTHAARRLHVHPNTVARRLERITELLGPAWQQPDGAFEVQLALRLWRVRAVLPGPVPGPDPGPEPDGVPDGAEPAPAP